MSQKNIEVTMDNLGIKLKTLIRLFYRIDESLKTFTIKNTPSISKRVIYLFIIFFSLLNIVLRYAHISSKNFAGHMGEYSSVLISYGNAFWLRSFWSFFGRYPGSVPPGDIFLNTTVQILYSFDFLISFSVYRMILAVFAFLSAFLLAREINPNALFALFVSSIFSLSREFLSLTTINTGFRGTFLALLPITIWLFLKITDMHKKDIKINLIFLFFLFVLCTIHRMIIFIVFIIGVYFIIKFLYFPFQKIYMLYYEKRHIFIIGLSFLLVIILISSFFIVPKEFFTPRSFPGLYRYPIMRGKNLLVLITNLSAQYTFYMGFPIFFVPFGFLYFYGVSPNKKQLTFLLILLMISPFLIDIEYIILFSLIFLSILSGLGLLVLIKSTKKFIHDSKIILTIVLVVLLISPSFVTVRAGLTNLDQYGFVSTRPSVVEHEVENTGLYIKYHTEDSNFERNDRRIGAQLSTFSGKPQREGLRLVNQLDLKDTKIIPITDFVRRRHWFYVRDNIWEDRYRPLRYTLQGHHVRNNLINDTHTGRILINQNIHYYVINRGRWNRNNPYIFTNDVRERRYNIYENGPYSIYYIK